MNRGESKRARRRHEHVANSGHGGVERMRVGAGGTPLDARLLPAALGCWGVTIAGITLGWRAGIWVSTGLGLAVAGTGIVLARSRFRAPHRAAWWVVLAALLASAGFGVAASWQAYRVSAHPLGRLAAGSVVTAEMVAGDPKPLPAHSFGGRQWTMRATVREFRYGATSVHGDAAVTVIMPERIWSDLVPGQHVTVRARLDHPWRRDLTVAVLRAQGPPIRVGPRPWWQSVASAVRGNLSEAAERALPPDAAGVLPGLIDGDISGLPDHVREDFRAVDLTHLIAVSGTNVSIVLAGVLLAARALTLDPRWGAVLAALALIGFVVLARPSPSVLRAAVMGAIAVLAMVTGRRKQALPALCAAVIVLIALSPQLAVDIGFALSVLATAGLILLAPSWSQWLEQRGWPPLAAEAFGVAAAAFAVTTPIIAALTGHVSGVAIVANVLVEPVVAPITLLGVGAAALSCCWQPAAVWVLNLAEPPMWWLLFVAEHAAALGISLPLPAGVRGAALAGALIGGGVAVLGRLGTRRTRTPAGPAPPPAPGDGSVNLSPATRRIVP
ncbi:competence protein ComEC [Nocardia kruczakiae]|uniref:Competence protein ComEC n=1 Tax=Nocardia kruczakiae TaxID=261477 RepID=A0ABU1XEJ9_9NOCA|nr:ComEC/Rec2 family competence protein [Nocardia kruczakiae]MDR7168491.1 competence protein ComEC [Nocardia kruczakiae]